MGESTNYHGNHRTVAAGTERSETMPRDCGAGKYLEVDTVRGVRSGTSPWIRFELEFKLILAHRPRLAAQ